MKKTVIAALALSSFISAFGMESGMAMNQPEVRYILNRVSNQTDKEITFKVTPMNTLHETKFFDIKPYETITVNQEISSKDDINIYFKDIKKLRLNCSENKNFDLAIQSAASPAGQLITHQDPASRYTTARHCSLRQNFRTISHDYYLNTQVGENADILVDITLAGNNLEHSKVEFVGAHVK